MTVMSRTRLGFVGALAAVAFAVYAPNLNDYFLGDDFDLIGSFYGKPPTHFLQLLASNASGDAWNGWGVDSSLGRGFLRPVQIWLLEADFVLWGTNPLGFHLTATLAAAAMVVAVSFILLELGAAPSTAFLSAFGVAVHPVLAAIVPFIAAREETIATSLCLFAFWFLLRARLQGSSQAPALACFALALLTKESAVVWPALALGYDALVRSRERGVDARRLVRFYGTLALMGIVYLFLRWLAFGNVVGGDGRPTHYLSLGAFAAFHGHFWRHLVGPRLFEDHGIAALPWLAAGIATGLVALSFVRSRADAGAWARSALFFGPFWYLATTMLLYGIYYDDRHHSLPLAGLALFLGLAADRVLRRQSRLGRGLLLAAALGCLTTTLLPVTLRSARLFHEASRATALAREGIEMLTKGLPDGSDVLLVNAPVREDPPFYFGWGLQPALRRPFTPSDTSRRLRIFDRKDRALNRPSEDPPEAFDLEIVFRPDAPETIERSRLLASVR